VPIHYYDMGEGMTTTSFFPIPVLYARYGISPRFDVGVDWVPGPDLTVNGKWQFTDLKLDGALAVSGSFYGFAFGGTGVGAYSLSPRLILSKEAAESFPWMVNAGVNYGGYVGGTAGLGGTVSGNYVSFVAGAGLPFRLGQTRTFRIMPEVSAEVPVSTSVDYAGESASTSLAGMLRVSIGVGFTYVGNDE
jgi:hypothetical protein